jgi:hypothetical protein
MSYSAPLHRAGNSAQGPGADDGGPTYRRYDRSGMPMMRSYGGYRSYGHPFGFGFMLFGGLLHLILPLGLLALIAYVFYQMGKRPVQPRCAARPLLQGRIQPPLHAKGGRR